MVITSGCGSHCGSSPQVVIVLQALKACGMMVDNGSAWGISGVSDAHWETMRCISCMLGSAFEAVDESTLPGAPDLGWAQFLDRYADEEDRR